MHLSNLPRERGSFYQELEGAADDLGVLEMELATINIELDTRPDLPMNYDAGYHQPDG